MVKGSALNHNDNSSGVVTLSQNRYKCQARKEDFQEQDVLNRVFLRGRKRNSIEAWWLTKQWERDHLDENCSGKLVKLKVKQADELENILTKKFLRFLSMRAEAFQVLRRKPVQVVVEEMQKHKLIDFIVQFMEFFKLTAKEVVLIVFSSRGRLYEYAN
ncbi:hypothetical protein M8C21_006921, partial [Ambrosia artemisiifolia]